MRKPHRNGRYPSPYTAVITVDGVAYLIVERQRRGFRAVELTCDEVAMVTTAFEDAHADVEARIVGARRRRGRSR